MITRFLPAIALLAVASSLSAAGAEARASGPESPQTRPRLTDSLRVQAEQVAKANAAAPVVTMDKVVVREGRLPSGPAREPDTVEKFSITEGGYLRKNTGAKYTTEVGLWRHLSVLPHVDEARDGNEKIRMGLVRINW